MYIKELKQEIKDLTDELEKLKSDRRNNLTFSYTQEEKVGNCIIKPERTVEEYTDDIIHLSNRLLKLKGQLRKANETICDNGQSIIENITELKQKTAEYHSICTLFKNEKISRNNSFRSEAIEYSEVNYDIGWANQYAKDIKEEISELQNTIDRANLTTKI